MNYKEYELSVFTEENLEEVIDLESFLWQGDKKSNREGFIWKHLKNPLFKEPIGIIAKCGNKIVGFRGFMPSRWSLNNQTFDILSPCDVVVHPNHRRKGLFTAMTKFAMNLYKKEFRFFLNLSSNKYSTPGYIKLGWEPIYKKTYLRHFNFINILKSKCLNNVQPNVIYGKFGEIEVSNRCYANELFDFMKEIAPKSNKISLCKNFGFFNWRFENPTSQHIFYYHWNDSVIDGYVVLKVDNFKAKVMDYEGKINSYAIYKIFDFILKHNKFCMLSIFNVNISNNFIKFLHKNHFLSYRIIEKIVKGKSYNLPILIRPVKESYSEHDWFINDLDVRDINSWHITEICSDGA